MKVVGFGKIIMKKIRRKFPLSTVYKGSLTERLKKKEKIFNAKIDSNESKLMNTSFSHIESPKLDNI